jgi:hypothetical protein
MMSMITVPMVGDFYEDEYGSLYEITEINDEGIVTICRLRDKTILTVSLSKVRWWISNRALTTYLTAEEISK